MFCPKQCQTWDFPLTAFWGRKNPVTSHRPIGQMAQDFAAAFGVGLSDKHVYPVDVRKGADCDGDNSSPE